MIETDRNADRELQQDLDKAGEGIKRGAASAAKKGIRSAGRKISRSTGKAAAKFTAKKIASAFAAAFASLKSAAIGLIVAVGWPLLLVLIIVLSLTFFIWVGFELYYNDGASGGNYQSESKTEINDRSYYGTNVTDIHSSIGNDMAAMLYTRYSTVSYYYTIDDDPTMIQASDQPLMVAGKSAHEQAGYKSSQEQISEPVEVPVVDVEKREADFSLSPQLLMLLDKELNKGTIYPEQFIKPIYNTCLSDKSTSLCEMLPLTDEEGIVAPSNNYTEHLYGKSEAKPSGFDADFGGSIYEKEGKGESVSDYGLAPIFHYKSYIETSKVFDYKIRTFETVEPGLDCSAPTQTLAYDGGNLPDGVEVPPTELTFDTVHDAYASEDPYGHILPDSTKYVIDQLASFVGTIKNPTSQQWVSKGEHTVLDSYSVMCVTTKKAKDVGNYSDETGKYEVDGEMVDGDESVEVVSSRSLSYVKQGELKRFEPVATTPSPDVSEVKNDQYLSDYIANYEAYIPVDTYAEETYTCYRAKNIDKTLDWSKLTPELDQYVEKHLDLFRSDGEYFDKNYEAAQSNVSSPNECEADTVAIADSNLSMSRFMIDDMPEMQYMIMAHALNRSVTSEEVDSLEKLQIGEMSKKDLNVVEKVSADYGKMIVEAANEFGVDPNLLIAIASANFDQRNTVDDCLDTACGVMGVKRWTIDEQLFGFIKSSQVCAVSYETNQQVCLNINQLSVRDPKENIRIAAAQLQSMIKKYRGNYLLMLQAYQLKEEDMTELLNLTSERTGVSVDQYIDQVDLMDWISYRNEISEAEDTFIETVLMLMGSNKSFTIRDAAGVRQQINFSYLLDSTVSNAGSAIKATNARIKRLYMVYGIDKKNGNETQASQLRKYWKIIYSGQKDMDREQFDMKNYDPSFGKKYGQRLHGDTLSTDDQESLMTSLIAFDDGRSIFDYEGLSEGYWRTKYTAMFKSVGGKEWSIDYDVEGTLGENVKLPAKTVIPISTFGASYNDSNIKEIRKDVDFKTIPETDIYSIATGVVMNVTTGSGLQSIGNTVTIDYSYFITDKDDTDLDNLETKTKRVSITYSNLGSVDVESGTVVLAGEKIGTANEEGTFKMQMMEDDLNVDPTSVINYIKLREEFYKSYNESLQNGSTFDPEQVIGLEDQTLDANKIHSSDTWSLPVNGTVSAGTWAYAGTSTPHEAIDIAAPIGTDIRANGDGYILGYYEASPNHPGSGHISLEEALATTSKANWVVYATIKDDVVYTVLIYHINQGSVTSTLGDSISEMFHEGEKICEVGHNGKSTGAHAHIAIINHGDKTLEEVATEFRTYGYFFGVGDAATNAAHRCEYTSNKPCMERADELMGY